MLTAATPGSPTRKSYRFNLYIAIVVISQLIDNDRLLEPDSGQHGRAVMAMPSVLVKPIQVTGALIEQAHCLCQSHTYPFS